MKTSAAFFDMLFFVMLVMPTLDSQHGVADFTAAGKPTLLAVPAAKKQFKFSDPASGLQTARLMLTWWYLAGLTELIHGTRRTTARSPVMMLNGCALNEAESENL